MINTVDGYSELTFLRGIEPQEDAHRHGAEQLQEQNQTIGQEQETGINSALGREDENQDSERVGTSGNAEPKNDTDLTDEEKRRVQELKATDQKVRTHEMAHLSAAGGIAVSGANFEYTRGPDGVNYAVGGEVRIDTSSEGDPQKTIDKARRIASAAMAPADPSPQDRQVAARARAMEAQAQVELQKERQKEAQGTEDSNETQATEQTQDTRQVEGPEESNTPSTSPISEGTRNETTQESPAIGFPRQDRENAGTIQLPNAGISSYLQNQSYAPASPLLPEFNDLPTFSFANQTIQPQQSRNNLELVA